MGYEVCGSDISEAMLAQARKNLARFNVDVPLQKIDFRELPQHFDRRFEAVVCLSTSIAEIPGMVETIRAFNSMHKILCDGGILVLTQGTTDKQWKEKPRFILAVNRKDFSRLFVIDYFSRGARYNIVDIFQGKDAPALKVWSIEYARILLRDEYERLLQAAGFRTIDFYGTYQFEPYDKEKSDRLIVVAHK